MTPKPPSAPRARAGEADLRCETVVVGAGLSGLSAAFALQQAGRDVVVLEARQRVGGRTYDVPLGPDNPLRTELGGQFVGPRHVRVHELVRRFGLTTFPTYDTGRHIVQINGTRRRHRGRIPPLPPWALADAGLIHHALDRRARRMSGTEPWEIAESDDAHSVQDWLLTRRTSATGRTFIRLLVQGLIGTEPEDVALVHLLHYLQSNGGLMALAATKGGAQQDRVAGGTQAISERMAEQLGPDVVRLGHEVADLAWQDDRVEVRTRAGLCVRATSAVVAVPPALQRRLSFTPALPADRARLIESLRHGDVIKVAVVYDRPWWRELGLSGQVVSDTSLAPVVFDNSPPSGSPGILMSLVGGARGQRLRSVPAPLRREAMLEALAEFFGPQAMSAVDYHEQDWSQETFTGGCYGAFFPPGVWSRYGRALRPPVGPLHWAGTETAVHGAGYMEGAVESGRRAAAAILARSHGDAELATDSG